MPLTMIGVCSFFVPLAVVISGCMTFGNPQVRAAIEASNLPMKGDTKERVRTLLGEPSEILDTGEGFEQWYFAYGELQFQPGVVIPGATASDSQIWKVFVVFDRNDRVIMVHRKRIDSTTASGLMPVFPPETIQTEYPLPTPTTAP
jgi:hypothetical protein